MQTYCKRLAVSECSFMVWDRFTCLKAAVSSCCMFRMNTGEKLEVVQMRAESVEEGKVSSVRFQSNEMDPA